MVGFVVGFGGSWLVLFWGWWITVGFVGGVGASWLGLRGFWWIMIGFFWDFGWGAGGSWIVFCGSMFVSLVDGCVPAMHGNCQTFFIWAKATSMS